MGVPCRRSWQLSGSTSGPWRIGGRARAVRAKSYTRIWSSNRGIWDRVQADELRVKKQGGIVWMAMAMMVQTRLWLGGAVSEQRDMTLIRRLIERVRRCAAHCPLLVCTDGLCTYIRAIRETFRDPVHTGKGGRPRLRPWRNVLIAQVVKRYERRRVAETDRRLVEGTPAR